MAMDAWVSIPFVMILLLAGLQALPKEILEAARVDGANAWQRFWQIIFPLMLPVSVTAVILRIIFELKLADIVINVTSGGPGGATDTVSSFIYPRVSRPLECRLRHHAGRVLLRPHHHLRDAARSALVEPLHAEDDVDEPNAGQPFTRRRRPREPCRSPPSTR